MVENTELEEEVEMGELCKIEVDGGFDFACKTNRDLSEDQKTISSILMKNGYPCRYERYLPEGTGIWRVRLVIYQKEQESK